MAMVIARDAARGGGGSGNGGSDGTLACDGGDSSGDGGWTPSSTFLEQSLKREFTPFFLQVTAKICGGVAFPLIEPKLGQEGKGPT